MTDDQPSVRVLIVDDDVIVRNALREILSTECGMQIVGVAESGRSALQVLAHESVDVVLMDLVMPGMNGVEATRAIKESYPGVRVLVLTSLDDESAVQKALAGGASGYLLKDAAPASLADAVKTANAGLFVASVEPMNHIVQARRSCPTNVPDLTRREREVLTLLCRGLSNNEIARELHLSLSGAKAGVAAVMAKLQATSRLHAVAIAHELRLVHPSRASR